MSNFVKIDQVSWCFIWLCSKVHLFVTMCARCRILPFIKSFIFLVFDLTGSRPLFGTSHYWSKSLNPILCVSKWWSASKKLLAAFFWPKTGFFLPVRAAWSSKSWQNTQSKCKNCVWKKFSSVLTYFLECQALLLLSLFSLIFCEALTSRKKPVLGQKRLPITFLMQIIILKHIKLDSKILTNNGMYRREV